MAPMSMGSIEMKRVGIFERGGISLAEALLEARRSADLSRVGAIGCFIGIVREVADDGSRVKGLWFETERAMAERALQEIADWAMGRPGIADVRIYHKVGELGPGEDIMYVIVSASHRRELFETMEMIIERIKREVPIWKKELTEFGGRWVSSK
ncbi:MAG: molybdenum cofactor biosynthesis protein MoaE [Candidatus Bathyarchaeia archaeon]